MPTTLRFDRSHPGHYGVPVELSPLVRRVVANNPGPMTFTGTVTHLVGRGQVAVIDPGPDDADHLMALLSATAGEAISHIILTHTHRDHVDGVEELRAATGAQVLGCSPCESADSLPAYSPQHVLGHGERVHGNGWTLQALATPGHTANHLAYALQEEHSLFPGDLVMAWSTTVIAPPAGSMRNYKASLRLLLSRSENIYYPAHGPSLADAKPYVAALLQRRLTREQQVLGAVATGVRSVPELLAALYPGLSEDLHGAARLSLLAHLQELVEDGRLLRSVMPGGETRFEPV